MYKDPFGKEHRYGPPAGWVQPEGQESLGPAEWDALVKRGVSFPRYYGPAVLMRTFGNCLSPLLVGGQHYLRARPLAPDETLIDGGLYVLEPENQEEIRRICEERLGVVKTGIVSITKFLRYVGFEWWMLNREGIDCLGMGTVTHEVVGVIPLNVAKQVGIVALSESEACGQIQANAVSQIISSAFSGIFPATICGITVPANSTTGYTSVFTVSGTMTGAPVAVDLIMGLAVSPTSGAISWSAGVTVYRDGVAISGATVATLNSTNSVWSAGSGNTYPIAITLVDGSPTAGAHTYAIMITGSIAGGSATLTVNATTCSIKVREIKR
jgi:hypothetical protein